VLEYGPPGSGAVDGQHSTDMGSRDIHRKA